MAETAGGKQPFAIAQADEQVMALGGIWEGWRSPEGEIIITVPANPDVAELHDRMPLILEQQDWPTWLGEVEGDPAGLLDPSPGGNASGVVSRGGPSTPRRITGRSC